MTAAEGGEKRSDVASALQRESSELQACDPALSAALEGGDVLRGQVQAHHLPQEHARLLGVKPQVGSPHLDELPTRSQACKRQRRVRATREDQVQLRRQVLYKGRQGAMKGIGGDDVVVIEHQGDILCARVHEVIC